MATSGDPPRHVPARRTMGLAPVTAARAHLECTGGPEKGQTFRVAPGTTTLGRDAACEVALTETAVSRQHCRIERRGDQWLLKNLSDNGTRLNRKPVDEAPLADGDEIRVGAKTRLRFVTESVALTPSGRPQFRPRGTAEEAEQSPAEKSAEEGKQPSLLRRRKGLFIGLGIYLLALVLLGAVLALRGTTGTGRDQIPVLGLEDMIRPAPGAQPLRLVRESQQGVWCEDELGQPVLVPIEDFRSGKAERLAGIRQAIEGKADEYRNDPQFQTNPAAAKAFRDQALDLYDRRATKPGNLFGAVRSFQKALACYGGRGYFPDQPTVDKIHLDAIRELIDRVPREYNNAILDEKNGDYGRAAERYQQILKMVPEKDNPIVVNVNLRLTALQVHLKKR
ncbi:MAG: FHA domain-containing protein [Phycisphaerae bacterium]|nr:FHA domain-containing protein [Phycisphaerae bacterium]